MNEFPYTLIWIEKKIATKSKQIDMRLDMDDDQSDQQLFHVEKVLSKRHVNLEDFISFVANNNILKNHQILT